MAVIKISDTGIGYTGGDVGQRSFDPDNPLDATNQNDASFEPSDNTILGGAGSSNGSSNSNSTVTNTTGAIASVPTSRTILFTITSSPIGAAIFVNGVNTQFITPHVMKYLETELLTPQVITLKNGENFSTETYVISSEVVTTSIGTTGGTTGGGGGSGGTETGNGQDFDRQTFRPEVDPNGNPNRGNAQQ